MRRSSLALLLALGLVVVLVGCGGSESSPPVSQNPTVSISPATTTVIAGQQKQFTATVTGTSNSAVAWSMSGSGCGSSCGSIDANGLYTAPPLIPQSATITVTASLQSNTSVTGTAVITHLPITISVTPSTLQPLQCAETAQLTATVQNHSDLGVTWFVNGIEGGNSVTGYISASGLYTAPAAVPSPDTVTITAKSHADPSKSIDIHTRITQNYSSRLEGNYVIFWQEGELGTIQFLGSFVADGNGSITNGNGVYRNELDLYERSFTGTYRIDDYDRGSMQFVGFEDVPQLTVNFVVEAAKFAESTNFARIYSGGRMLGYIEKQNTSAFSSTVLTGDWAFRMTGFAFNVGNTVPADIVGRFTNTAGTVSLGEYDLTEHGQLTDQNVNFTGATSIDAGGRGTLTLTTYGRMAGTAVFYVISANKVAIMQTASTAPALAMSGTAERQPELNISGTTLNGDYAFYMNDAIGRLTMDGASHITNGNMDILDDVNGATNVHFTGTYSVNPYGRTAITLFVPGSANIAAVGYVVSLTKLYLMGLPGGPGGEAMAQVGNPFNESSWVNDIGIIGFAGNGAAGYLGAFGPVWLADTHGSANAKVDFRNLSGTVTWDIDATISYSIEADGRCSLSLSLPAPIGTIPLHGYFVDAQRILLLGAHSGVKVQGEINLLPSAF